MLLSYYSQLNMFTSKEDSFYGRKCVLRMYIRLTFHIINYFSLHFYNSESIEALYIHICLNSIFSLSLSLINLCYAYKLFITILFTLFIYD